MQGLMPVRPPLTAPTIETVRAGVLGMERCVFPTLAPSRESVDATHWHRPAPANQALMRAIVIGCIMLTTASSAGAQEEATSAGDVVGGCRVSVSYYKNAAELVQQG